MFQNHAPSWSSFHFGFGIEHVELFGAAGTPKSGSLDHAKWMKVLLHPKLNTGEFSARTFLARLFLGP